MSGVLCHQLYEYWYYTVVGVFDVLVVFFVDDSLGFSLTCISCCDDWLPGLEFSRLSLCPIGSS